MKTSLKEIWKNRKQIVEGITNSVIRDEFVEEVSKLRIEICNACPNKDTVGKECVMPGSQPCCAICGCSLKFKTRALSTACPEKKWGSIVSEKKEDSLDNLKD
jgi:radical SAM superfamily enzyme